MNMNKPQILTLFGIEPVLLLPCTFKRKSEMPAVAFAPTSEVPPLSSVPPLLWLSLQRFGGCALQHPTLVGLDDLDTAEPRGKSWKPTGDHL